MTEQATQVEQVEVDGWRIDPHPTDGFEIIDSRNVFIAGAIQSKRHANLIAAAPELLQALRQAMNCIRINDLWNAEDAGGWGQGPDGWQGSIGDVLHQVILKAEGK